MSAGRVVGSYELLDLLGQGAMGAVYRARHRALGVERALKLLTPGGPAGRQDRFEREGRNLARVEHENVVRIHEAGQHAGQPYLVMDLVAGEPLDRLLARGRPPLAEALDIAAGLARGLAALHAAGIVHRDLKPPNVLVDEARHPVIVDFGLALAPERDERLTRTGVMVGTPMYMAPEQLTGATVSGAADVHALGLITFELTTGAHPLGATESIHELLARLTRAALPAPSTIDDSLPASLDALCARLLARAPADRPGAGEAAVALQRLADDVRSGATRSARRASLLRRAATLGAAAFAAAALAGLVSTRDGGRADAPLAAITTTTSAAPRPAPLLAAAAEELRDLEALDDPRARLGAAEAWLERWPEHADGDRAQAVARRARALRPLLSDDDDPTTTAAFFPDDRRVLAVAPHRLRALDALDGRELARSASGAAAAAPLEGGDLLATGGRLLARFDGTTLEHRALWQVDDDRINHLAATPDGARVVLGGAGAAWVLTLPALDDGVRLPHDSPVWSVAISRDGRHVVTGSGRAVEPVGVHDTKLRIWTSAGQLLREVDLGARVMSLAVEGDVVLAGTSRGDILRTTLAADADVVAFTSDHVAVPEGKLLLRPGVHGLGIVSALALSDDGQRLWSGSTNDTRELRAWDARDGRERYHVLGLRAGLRSIDVSPDGRRLVTCDERGVVAVWATD